MEVKTLEFMYSDLSLSKNNQLTTVHLLNLKLILESLVNKWISILENKIQILKDNILKEQ